MAHKQKKRKTRDTGNKPEPQDDKEELVALKAKLAKLQSRAGTGAQRERKKTKIKVDGDDKLPDCNPAPGSLAPGPSSTLAEETEKQGQVPPNGISVKYIAGGVWDRQKKKKKHAISSSSCSAPDTESFGSSTDTSIAERGSLLVCNIIANGLTFKSYQFTPKH